MGYIVNKDGDIQTSKVTIELSEEEANRAAACGLTRIEGLKAVVEEKLGIQIDDVERITYAPKLEGGCEVVLQSRWARPSRR